MLVPLLVAYLFGDIQIATIGVMGSFAYLAFQYRSLTYNMIAISLHGICLFLAFTAGIYTSMLPWTIPFVISFISFSAFLVTKLYNIPKPGYFFILMLFATGINLNVTENVLQTSSYLFWGIVSSLLSGFLISLSLKLPFKNTHLATSPVSFPDRYANMITQNPNTFLNAIHFATILFCSAYVSTLFSTQNGYWILISSAAILAGEDMETIKLRSHQRIIGSLIGLLIGLLLISLSLPQLVTFTIIIILNICVEYFMPRNYAIANFFTNPLVLLLSSLASGQIDLSLIPFRFICIFIGSSIALSLMMLITYGVSLAKNHE